MMKGLLIAVLSVICVASQNIITMNDTMDLSHLLQSSNYHHIGSYDLLHVENKCAISQCPASTPDTINFYNYCFQRQCSSYDQYHCLNSSGKTVNFCAKIKNCNLRSVDKAVVNEMEPSIINIYNVPCKYGHFQPNDHHSCFTECAEDTSIGILETTKYDPIPLAYCRLPVEIGCNPFGKMFFQLDSKDDNCTGTKQCLASEDLLPDCTCDAQCPPNYVRLPETNFSCSPSVGHVTPPTSKTEEAVQSTMTGSNAKRGKDYADEILSSPTDSVGLEVQPSTDHDHADSNSNIGIPVTIIIVVGVFVTSAVFVKGYVVMSKYKRSQTNQQYQRVTRTGSDANHVDTKSGVHKESTTNTYNANNITFVHGDQIKVDMTGTYTQSEAAVEREEADTESIQLPDEQQMELLKGIDADSTPQYDPIRKDASLTGCKQVY